MEKTIVVSSKLENLRLVETFIEDVCNDCKISSEMFGNILISSLEATNNAIVHGNKLNEKENVKIIAKADKRELRISIEDNGKGFNYDDVPDPTSPENLEKLNGRGIFLMRRLSDGVSFNNNGKIVELLFNF